MKRIEQWMERFLLPIAVKVGNIKGLIAIRDGIALAMPLIIIGSVFLIISSFPISGWTEGLGKLADGRLLQMMNHVVNSSFGIMGLIAAFGIGRGMANQYQVDGTSAGVLAVSAWLVLTPNIIGEEGQGIPVTYLGSRGIFIAIVVGLITAWIFQFFIRRNIVIKMPESVPPAVSRSFAALIPGTVILLLVFLLAFIIDLSAFENAHMLLATSLAGPLGFIGGTLAGAMLTVFLNSLFWFVGIHGGNIVGSVTGPIFLANTDANRLAFQSGQELPQILTSQFFDMFAYIGGGGAVLGLVIALLFFGKSAQSKALKPIASVPNLFNISEPVMFGLPVMLNMNLLIPFLLTPVINVVIAYTATNAGLLHKTIGVAVPWTTPPLISGFLATGHISGVIWQLIIIGVDVLCYLPFFLLVDKAQRDVE